MGSDKTDIYVYADWQGLSGPVLMGVLSAHQAKGRKAFSFSYDEEFLRSKSRFSLDPDLMLFAGPQYPVGKENFGLFLDSMPDTWGRTLLKRKAAMKAREAETAAPTLYDIDFLLGVYDRSRMGGLRFKLDPEGPFLDNDANFPTPPWSSVRELQFGAGQIEHDPNQAEAKKWLNMLLAPGSSLGGARPKANILDEHGQLWIAKFPSKNDEVDKAKWEYLAYRLAVKAGVTMSECRLQKVDGKHHTFFTKRFDRDGSNRIHFASAMTMTGHTEESLRDETASYLDLAEFIQYSGADNTTDLHQLWRRIVFSISISNTDDHLRNHGFLLNEKGWRLSPAYDINPSTEKNGLALNIDMNDNALDLELAKSVGTYFQLKSIDMEVIISEVAAAVKTWKSEAQDIGISRAEQLVMEPAFRV